MSVPDRDNPIKVRVGDLFETYPEITTRVVIETHPEENNCIAGTVVETPEGIRVCNIGTENPYSIGKIIGRMPVEQIIEGLKRDPLFKRFKPNTQQELIENIYQHALKPPILLRARQNH